MRQPGVVEGEARTDMYSTAGETEAVTQHSFSFQSGCLWTGGHCCTNLHICHEIQTRAFKDVVASLCRYTSDSIVYAGEIKTHAQTEWRSSTTSDKNSVLDFCRGTKNINSKYTI